MGTVGARLKTRLEAALSPQHIEIIDDSDKHKGHSGASAAGESHFTVIITAAAFSGLTRVARQRLVMAALAEELAGPVHALSIKATAPGEG